MRSHHPWLLLAHVALCIGMTMAVSTPDVSREDDDVNAERKASLFTRPSFLNLYVSTQTNGEVTLFPRAAVTNPFSLSSSGLLPNTCLQSNDFELVNPWATKRLKKVSKLGKGGWGKVYKALDTRRGDYVAAKTMIRKRKSKYLVHEVKMTRLVGGHNNIPKIYDVFQYGDQMCLTMEVLAGGDLGKLLVNRGPLSMAESAAMLRTMARAVKHIHDRNIVHFDIKPENFAFRYETRRPEDLVLIDFGVAKNYIAGELRCKNSGGTRSFIPAFRKDGQECSLEMMKKSDSFALGRTLFMMAIGGDPHYSGPIENLDLISDPHLHHLLQHLTTEDPDQLLTVDEILAHPFMLNTDLAMVTAANFHRSLDVSMDLKRYALANRAMAFDPFEEGVIRGESGGWYHSIHDVQVLVSVSHNTDDEQVNALHEILVARQCESAPILKLVNVYTCQKGIIIVKDIINGPHLDEALKQQKGTLSPKEAAQWFCQIVRAVAALHDKAFIHGELSLEKFAFKLKQKKDNIVMHDVGTNKGSFTQDIFKLGIILHQLVLGKEPETDASGGRFILPASLSGLDNDLCTLLVDLIVSGTIKSCHDILNHPFMMKKVEPIKHITNTLVSAFTKLATRGFGNHQD